jgi:cation:H+ antiporter
VAVLVWKARSTAGFNALISSKLNQWTLLIGTLVVVYSLALGQYGTLPFDFEQTGEIWITAAQSYFAVAILVNFTVSVREATALFGLFISQVALEFVFLKLWVPFTGEVFGLTPKLLLLLAYTVVYLLLGTILFVARRRKLLYLLRLSRYATATALGRPATRPERGE